MSQTINLAVKGLHTYQSELSGVPQGALKVADDVNISRTNIVEPRRGYDFLTYDPAAIAKSLKFYNSTLFVHAGTTLYADTGSAFASRGALTIPTNAITIKTAAVSNNLYLTGSDGIYKMDNTAAVIYKAGIAKGTIIEANGAMTGTGTAVLSNKSVAYRYVIARKDVTLNTVFGGVSARYVVTAAGSGPYDVPLRVYIPSGLDNTYYVQVNRTAGVIGTPSDECQLCYEYPLTTTDCTNGYFNFTDICPDDLLGATIYIAASQQGISNDNYVPPMAVDICEYKNCLFFGDVTSKMRLSTTLVAVNGLGLVNNDTLTIVQGATTEIYTAKSAGAVPASKFFLVETVSTSPSVRIDTTAKSLISVINSQSTIVYAYLDSNGIDGLPGRIRLEERTFGNAAFTFDSSRDPAWSPQPTAALTASNDQYKNGLMFSKQGIPEAVPLKNIIRVGSSDDRIRRILALRDGLFIFKENDGVYILRGENEFSFTVSLLDNTAKIKAYDSLAVVNNLIYGLFDSGICEVSDTGVQLIGTPIKDSVLNLYGTALAQVKAYAFGVAYDQDGKYILGLPSSSGDTTCTQQFVYDVYGQNWSRWTLNVTSMAVSPSNGRMYTGYGSSAKIQKERKDYSYTDYADFGSTCTITSYSTTTVYINNTALMTVGDIISQGNSFGYIESISLTGGYVVIDIAQVWTLATADVSHLKAISSKVEWVADFADNPAGLKQYYEVNLLFKQGFQNNGTVYFYSDLSPSETSVALTSASGNGAFGSFSFGEEAFGGEVVKAPTRLGVPAAVSRCNQLSVRFETSVAYSDFQLNGLSLTFNPTSTRTAR